jgi:soluble lytic murein transglycosylase
MVGFMPRRLTSLFLLMLCYSIPIAGFTDNTADLRQKRADFLAAERALRQGDMAQYRDLLETLRDYPLFPYLRYQYLSPRVGRIDESEIIDFVDRYAGSPLGVKLHIAWIQTLAARQQWSRLLEHYPAHAENTELDCYRRRALYNTGERTRALDGVEDLWLVGEALPAACDQLFTIWRETGALTSDMAWKRFKLAMRANQTRVARHLIRYMDAAHREWADTWLKVYASPRLIEPALRQPASRRVPNDVIVHAIKRLARVDLEHALKVWDAAASKPGGFEPDERADVERSLALALAVRGNPKALERIWAIDNLSSDTSVREWRTRLSLAREDWETVLKSIYAMPESERESPDWRYWQARALEALGQKQQAEEIYVELAISRGYYSFLAADHLALPYQFGHTPLSADDANAVTTEAYPGLARARELYFLDRIVDARREWYFATRNMADWQLHAAASLAQSWGWYDRAILTLAHSEIRDDLDIRFPLAYRDPILEQAKAHDIDPALAFALVRQESAFATDARSSAGALGLMQLMPTTAKRLARFLNIPLSNNRTAVLDIQTNLRLGMAYLRQMLDRYNHQVPALAAYNAGQQRVDAWLPRENVVPADVWTDTVPFRETRDYVQNIMFFSVIYQQRMELPDSKLAQRMTPVGPKAVRIPEEIRQNDVSSPRTDTSS